jgi:GMP synthase (glutamine-hydrolysing)
MRILIVKNLGQLNHLIWRTLRDLDVEAQLIPNTTPLEEVQKKADAIVIGGGPYSVYDDLEVMDKMGYCKDYITKFKGPLLGICLGHQAIAQALGGKVARGTKGEYGFSEIAVDESTSIMKGLSKFTAWVSHFDEVKEVPKGFKALAHSEVCKVEAMANEKKGIYGVQFHPEANHTEHGEDIFRNFIELVKR